MKKQIRRGVFETNSSSIHSISISKESATIGKSIYFGIGEFGWEEGVASPADYLYTAILCQDDYEDYLDKLKEFLDKNHIQYNFEKPKWCGYDGMRYLDNGHLDHGCELREFLDAVLNDDDMLTRYLFGDSHVYTGNDNQICRPDGCYIAYPYYWNEDGEQVLNPYHDEEHYDYFVKEN